jgi:hypothetical protein
LKNEVLQLITVEIKLYYRNHTIKIPFAWGFFFVNDDLHVDFENLQMLQCIIYISEKMASNFLSQSSILKRGLTIIRLMGTLP